MKMRRKITDASLECGVDHEFVMRFIEEEWVVPSEEDYLDEEDIARIRLIHELKEEFGVNDEGIPIILHLIDQLNRMRLELKHLRETEKKRGP